MRLFEAAACACPIISDYWEGLDEFFNVGKEILVARTPDEVLSYLMDVSGRERKAMGERARARILAKHTAAHRAAELESYVIDLLNGKAGRTQSLDSITRRSERAAPGA